MQDCRHTPEYCRVTESALGTDTVNLWTKDQLANAVRQQEPTCNHAVIDIVDIEFGSHYRRQSGKD